jgi:hypothetical protein
LKKNQYFIYLQLTLSIVASTSILMNLLKHILNMWFLNVVVKKSKNMIILIIEPNNIFKFNMLGPTWWLFSIYVARQFDSPFYIFIYVGYYLWTIVWNLYGQPNFFECIKISLTKIICGYFLHLYQQYTITSSCKASPSYYYVQIISLLEHLITHLPSLLIMLSGAKTKSNDLSIIAYILSTKLFSFNNYGINNYIWIMMMALAMFNIYSFMNPWFICCCAQGFSMERSRENQRSYSARQNY